MPDQPDYTALAEQAMKDHQDANERYQQAKADSETAALRELVFTAASYGVTRLTLEPSDQGPYMLVSEIEPEISQEHEDYLSDAGSYDLSDYQHADWVAHPGVVDVEFEFRSEGIRSAGVDIKVAAEALLLSDRLDASAEALANLRGLDPNDKAVWTEIRAEVQADHDRDNSTTV
jgi:hypothetical protein